MKSYRVLCMLIAVLFPSLFVFGQTSWTGTTSTAWGTATNWTSGVPTSTVDAILGDANFIGINQPTVAATSSCKTLTIGGTVATTISLTKNLTVSGSVTINSNGTVTHPASTMSLTGSWTNNGTYTATSTTSSILFSGTVQSINGSAITSFRKLTVNAGSVLTLNKNINCTGASSLLSVSGTLNPNESPTYLVTADNITVNNAGVLKVNSNIFSGNYIVSTLFTLSAGSIVEYSATTTGQTISSDYTYSTLRVSGAASIKTLIADLPLLRATSSTVGNIYVLSGTLDPGSFTINRATVFAGGTLSVSNGAFLKFGGSSAFPSGYLTTTLSLTSTVEFYGNDQTVPVKTFGNLILSGTSGVVTKTLPVTAFTVAGSLTSSTGTATSVLYTAGSNITVTGSFTIGAGTTFSGSSFSHGITGNWINNGTFINGTSTITLKGANKLISGNTTQNFYNLTITGSNTTAPGITDISISGNLGTSGSGTFIQSSPANLTMNGTTKTLTGAGIVLDNLFITGVVTTSSSFTLTGNLSVNNSFIASAGVVNMSGAAKTITNSGVLTLRGLLTSGQITTASNFTIATSLNNSGSFTATAGTITFVSSSLLSGTANLFNATINGTSLALAANSVMGIAGVFVITAGTFNVTSYVPNTVNYNGSSAQTIKGTIYNNLVLSNTGPKTAGAAITVNNAFTIAGGASFDGVTFTHTIVGNWINNGTFIAGTSTVQFTGATNSAVTGVTTFNIITVNKTLATYSITLLSNITVATINMTAGGLATGSNSITITTTRTGNGFITGTITRTHSFTSAVAYAFEGPNNLVTFAAGVSGVTSVTINVVVAPVADFPFNGAIGRTYTIAVPSGTYTATLRFHYEDAELNGNDESVMQCWKNTGAAWVVSGKTSNSTTSNYVEKTSLTSITGRWTMTDDGSVLTWNGSVSSDWSTAGNWTLVQGTFSGAPSSTDIAQIGIVPFTNQPIITSAATVKSLTFGSAQAVTLTMNTGGSLVANGSISGLWSAGATHSINVNAQTLTINGDLVLSDNSIDNAINLTVSTGTVSVLGTLNQAGGAAIEFTGAGTLNIGKNFIYSSGSFISGTSLVKYNGSVSQVVAAVPYYNLTIIKTGGSVATLAGNCTMGGSLVVTTGEFDMNGTVSITGSVTISTTAIIDASASILNVGGNWSKSATGFFNTGTGTVTFNGIVTQTISAGAFNILSFNKSAGTAVLSGNNTVNGDLSLTAGILDLSTYTLNQSSAGDIFSISDGATLLVAGASNFPTNFTSYVLGNNSVVHYKGTVAQTIADLSYGNLQFSNGGAAEKTFAGSNTINGDITINSGATVNSGNFITSLNGNWINSGGVFIPGTGDILLNGIAKTLSGNTTFNDVTVNGTYTVATSDMTFNGQFQVTPSGTYNAGSGVATLNNDFTNAGTITSTGTTTFSGTVLQNIRLINALQSTSTGIVNFNGSVSPILNSTSTPVFATLNINNTAGINPSVNWAILVACNIGAGASFNGGVYTHTFGRAFTNNGTLTSAGILLFSPTSAVTLQLSGTEFSSTGTVKFAGSGAITITGTPTSLQDVVIANTNAAGLTTPSGWTVNGKFSVNSNSIFNAGPYTYTVGGTIESDGTLSGGSSTFSMTSSTGELTASSETIFNHFSVAGTLTPQTDFRVAGDFINNGVYDGTLGVLIMTGGNAATIGGTTTPSAISQLTIEKTTGIAVTQNVNVSNVLFLNIFSGTLFTSTRTITQDPGGGILIINSGAALKLGGTNSLPGFSGYGLDINSTVEYAGSTQSIGNAADYGHLVISAAGNKNAFVAFVVRNNLAISAGTLNTSTLTVTHSIAGNFIMTGGTLTGTACTYSLNGTTNQVLTVTSNLVNLTVNKPAGDVVLGSAVHITQTLHLASGRIAIGSYDLTMNPGSSLTNYDALRYIIADGTGSLIRQVSNGSSQQFPVGSPSSYLPATVTLSAASATDNISVRVFPGLYEQGTTGPQYTTGVVNTTWAMSEATPGGSDVTITLQWPLAMELPQFSRSACRLIFRDVSYWDAGWADLVSTGTNPYTLTRSGLTGFSLFGVSTIAALPVTWLETYGRPVNGINHIYWGTATETNNAYFIIESSTDGIHFTAAGRMEGQLNSGSDHHYHFEHVAPGSPVMYYRIKQVDADGHFTYSRIIKIKVDSDPVIVRMYPVPVSTDLAIEVTSKENTNVIISITNTEGKTILVKKEFFVKGVNLAKIATGSFPTGVYYVRISAGSVNYYTGNFIRQ